MRGKLVAVSAVFLAGCSSSMLAGAGGRPGAFSRYLPGAEEEAAGPDDFEKPVGEAKPPEEEKPPEKAPPAPRRGTFGARAGMLFFTGAGEREVDPAFLVGASYAFRLVEEGAIDIEFGLDGAPVVVSDGDYSSSLVFLRGGARWTFGRGPRGCVAAGVSGAFESASSDPLDVDAQNSVMLIDLGAGLVGRYWEVRAVYSVVVGSGNAQGLAQLTAGVSF